MKTSKGYTGFTELSREAMLAPKEAPAIRGRKSKQLYIGIPRETGFQEKRISLTPKSVGQLVAMGHKVSIEAGAGEQARFMDKEYASEGARILRSNKEVYEAEIVLKVAPPSEKEIELMRPHQTLISAIHPATLKAEYIKHLSQKKVTALAYEYIKDESGIFPVVRSMGEIVGTTSILIAAQYLSNYKGGKGLMLGGIAGVPPTEVVILGAGTVGEYATRAALALGAQVKVFDSSLYRLRRLVNDVGVRVFTSVLQPAVLSKALKTADVAIGAMRPITWRSPCVVQTEMVQSMGKGSVIVDVSIDNGGCFETSRVTDHENPVFQEHGVIHYCVPNIASRVARTATYALTNIMTPILGDVGEMGGITELLHDKPWIRNGAYIFEGHLTNRYLGEVFNLPWKDLDLLMAAKI